MPAPEVREFYVSSNGARWEGGRDAAGHLEIVHLPNPASGGKRSVTDIALFLADRDHFGPEHSALLELLRSGSLDAPPNIAIVNDERA